MRKVVRPIKKPIMKNYSIKISFLPILLLLITSTATAQYDGSFDDIYFNRSISAQSSALGKSSKALSDNAFSIYANSALLGFQDSYLASFSTSSPYYTLENGKFNFYGIGGKLINNISVGITHLNFDTGESRDQQLTTLSFIYQPIEKLSLGANIQRFTLDAGTRRDEVGNVIGDATSNQYYFDLTSSYILPINLSFAEESSLKLGFTFENIFQQAIDVGFGSTNSKIELPSIITIGARNKLYWNQISEFFLVKNISLHLLAEYQEVINYKYKTRFSLGSQLGLNDYINLRIGYYIQNNDDFNIATNKSSISDLTYGAGANFPLSRFMNLDKKFILSIDFTRMQQPLYTTDNQFNIGKFSTFSASVKVDI